MPNGSFHPLSLKKWGPEPKRSNGLATSVNFAFVTTNICRNIFQIPNNIKTLFSIFKNRKLMTDQAVLHFDPINLPRVFQWHPVPPSDRSAVHARACQEMHPDLRRMPNNHGRFCRTPKKGPRACKSSQSHRKIRH